MFTMSRSKEENGWSKASCLTDQPPRPTLYSDHEAVGWMRRHYPQGLLIGLPPCPSRAPIRLRKAKNRLHPHE